MKKMYTGRSIGQDGLKIKIVEFNHELGIEVRTA